jgi:hypothetical protein
MNPVNPQCQLSSSTVVPSARSVLISCHSIFTRTYTCYTFHKVHILQYMVNKETKRKSPNSTTFLIRHEAIREVRNAEAGRARTLHALSCS